MLVMFLAVNKPSFSVKVSLHGTAIHNTLHVIRRRPDGNICCMADVWRNRRESENFTQRHEVELIKEDKRTLIESEIRLQVTVHTGRTGGNTVEGMESHMDVTSLSGALRWTS